MSINRRMEKYIKNGGYGHVPLRFPFKAGLPALAFASTAGRQLSSCQPLPAMPWLSKATLPKAALPGGGLIHTSIPLRPFLALGHLVRLAKRVLGSVQSSGILPLADRIPALPFHSCHPKGTS